MRGFRAALSVIRPDEGPRAAGARGRVRSAPKPRDQRERREGASQPQAGGEGRTESPYELPPRDWWATLRRTLKEIRDDRIALVGAGMAFYWFLAIFPALIASVAFLGLVNVRPQTIRQINESISSTLPPEAATILTGAVNSATDASRETAWTAAAVGLAIALWSASSGMVALQAGLNVAYDVGRDRSFVKKRLVSFGLLLLAALLGGVPTPFFAFGDALFFRPLAWAITAVAVITLFALFYYLGPNRHPPRWKWVTPGGLVGTALWVLVALLFSFYVDSFSSYGKTYGALAGVVVLLLWLYLSALAVLIGGELNAEIERQSEMDPAASGPGSAKGKG